MKRLEGEVNEEMAIRIRKSRDIRDILRERGIQFFEHETDCGYPDVILVRTKYELESYINRYAVPGSGGVHSRVDTWNGCIYAGNCRWVRYAPIEKKICLVTCLLRLSPSRFSKKLNESSTVQDAATTTTQF